MRGLPRWPAGIISLTAYWSVSRGFCTTTWHLFNPSGTTPDSTDLARLVSDWFTNALPDLLSVLGTDVSCSACRASSYGADALTYVTPLTANVGATGTSNPLNGALCMTWKTAAGPNSARSHTLLPLSDTLVDDTHQGLDDVSWAQAGAAARSFAQHMSTLVCVIGYTCVFVVVSRARGGAPLPIAQWLPVDTGDASQRVATLQRRIPPRRRVSPF